jgi:SCY1-like protein 1
MVVFFPTRLRMQVQRSASRAGKASKSGCLCRLEASCSHLRTSISLDPSALDSYQLHLLIHTLFNGTPPPNSDTPPTRGSVPPSIFPTARRLAHPNPKSRLSCDVFREIGFSSSGEQGAGFFRTNRLVKISEGIEGFSLASEGEKAELVRMIKDASTSGALPREFLSYKVLPGLVHAFEFGPCTSLLSLSSPPKKN